MKIRIEGLVRSSVLFLGMVAIIEFILAYHNQMNYFGHVGRWEFRLEVGLISFVSLLALCMSTEVTRSLRLGSDHALTILLFTFLHVVLVYAETLDGRVTGSFMTRSSVLLLSLWTFYTWMARFLATTTKNSKAWHKLQAMEAGLTWR